MKVCPACKESKEPSEFGISRARKSGLNPYCRPCYSKKAKAYYRSAAGQKAHRKNQASEKTKARKKQQYYSEAGQIARLAAQERRRKLEGRQTWEEWWKTATYKQRQRAARKAVYLAVKRGKLVRMPCAVCGDTHKIEGHHDSYTYDKRLSVVWLCAKHHVERHVELRQQGIKL